MTPSSDSGVLAGSQTHLDATLHALQTDQLPSLLPAAGDNLYRWMQLLKQVPGQFDDLSQELQQLYNALGHGTPNGPQIQQCLQRLAELTTQAAAAAPSETQEKLHQLADALAKAKV
jgi:ABC-type transporter Mla subunit MlaD